MRLLIAVLAVALALSLALPAAAAPSFPVLEEAPRATGAPPAPNARTGYVAPPLAMPTVATGADAFAAAEPPARWDWREHGAVSPVKNQSACGACYAFASVAALESRLLLDGAGLQNLSENQAKSCPWGTGGCSGGNDFMVANLFTQKGSVLESCDPYVAANTACKSSCPPQQVLTDWRIISGSTVPPVATLKNALYAYGPLFVSIYAGSSDAWGSEFSAYNGSYTLYHPGTESPNHAVLLIGWDDALVHAGGTGAWIVKNSWGTSWGGAAGYGTGRGFFTIAYGSAGIGSGASGPAGWLPAAAAGKLLYHDEAGFQTAWGCGTTSMWGMAHFVAPAAGLVERIELWSYDRTIDVDLYLYSTFAGGVLGGLLASRLNLSFAEPGYHSVVLPAPVAVSPGAHLFAAARITNASLTWPLVADPSGGAVAGSSYYRCTDSSGWTDLGQTQNDDVGIRIRMSPPPASVAGLEAHISSPDLELQWPAGPVHHYEVWFSQTTPHFTPGDGISLKLAEIPSPGSGATAVFEEAGGGSPPGPRYYLVRAVDAAGVASPPSNRVGIQPFPLLR